ncbi:MAG: hypothetical protein RL537_308 [Actinomycetota bacterium]
MISAEDLEEVSRQLGRPARDIVEVAARCVCKRPIVVKTKPRLEDGTPFPTLYYLTQKSATAAVSTLEATGYMSELQRELLEDDKLSNAYLRAHQKYMAEREEIEVVDEIEGISAGGMPYRVKCLHALIAHSLAAGKGVNPIGDLALAKLDWSPKVCSCI